MIPQHSQILEGFKFTPKRKRTSKRSGFDSARTEQSLTLRTLSSVAPDVPGTPDNTHESVLVDVQDVRRSISRPGLLNYDTPAAYSGQEFK